MRQLAQHGFQKITDKQPAADLFGITITNGADELRVGVFTEPHREVAVDRVKCWGFEKRRGRNWKEGEHSQVRAEMALCCCPATALA